VAALVVQHVVEPGEAVPLLVVPEVIWGGVVEAAEAEEHGDVQWRKLVVVVQGAVHVIQDLPVRVEALPQRRCIERGVIPVQRAFGDVLVGEVASGGDRGRVPPRRKIALVCRLSVSVGVVVEELPDVRF